MSHLSVGQFNMFSFSFGDDSMEQKINDFKSRKVKAKDIFTVIQIDKTLAYDFVRRYHYLGDTDFLAKYAFGLWLCGELVGVATFSCPQGNVALKGWFGLPNEDQSVLELSRLAMLPRLNGCNATSYLLSHSIRILKQLGIRAVITLADASRHVGSIYQVCNFQYYGMADDKTDFYRYPDGKKNPRGEVKDVQGVWISRTRKHRYAYIMDSNLKCLYKPQKSPKTSDTVQKICCGGVKPSLIGDINSGIHALYAQANLSKSQRLKTKRGKHERRISRPS